MSNKIIKKISKSYDIPVDNDTFEQNMEEMKQIASSSTQPPGVRGGNSVSGSTPDPESDDDVLKNAHQMGLAPDADLEHPTELNSAKDIINADIYRKNH